MMIISRDNRNILPLLAMGFLLVLFVASCFFIPKTEKAFSVWLSKHSGFINPSELFSIGLMIDDSYSFRSAAFEFETSEYLELVGVSIVEESDGLGLEAFWGKRSDGSTFVHIGFVCGGEPIPLAGIVCQLDFIASDSSYLRLVKAEAINDDLKIEKGKVRDPLRVFVLGK